MESPDKKSLNQPDLPDQPAKELILRDLKFINDIGKRKVEQGKPL